MTTRIKTIEYSLNVLKTLTNSTPTPFKQKFVYIPEFSGTVTFKSVIASACVQEIRDHVIGNYTTRTLTLSLNGGTARTYTTANTYTLSGEDTAVFFMADFTNQFVTEWTSGTKATLDISILVNNASATTRLGNVNVIIYITYEYDDTQTTQIKTVYIPLSCPVGALATSKPGSPCDIVPQLNIELPEGLKVYRDVYNVVQGNANNTSNTVDSTIFTQIDSEGILPRMSSMAIEAGAASDYWKRDIFKWSSAANSGLAYSPDTTHSWYIWSNAARSNHQQSYLNVTYEFDSTKNSGCYVSCVLPMETPSPMGGPTIGDFQRTSRQFWIQEPNPIVTKSVAFYPVWDQIGAISALYMRISGNTGNTHKWITYTDLAAVLCGSNGCMVKSGCGVKLNRGRNQLYYDVYRTDTTDFGFGLSGFWIVNYTCGKPTQGYSAANRTIRYHISGTLLNTAIGRFATSSIPINFTETDYFINGLGTEYKYVSDTTGTLYSINVLFEVSSNEGGPAWHQSYIDSIWTDPETGLHSYYSQIRDEFKRHPKDTDSSRLNIKSPRRWQVYVGNNVIGYHYIDLLMTIHNISYSVAGSISNYTGDGSGIVTRLFRYVDREYKTSGVTSAGGSFNITWWDNTEPVFVEARQGQTLVGISPSGYAS
jgi:hypothetical protein